MYFTDYDNDKSCRNTEFVVSHNINDKLVRYSVVFSHSNDVNLLFASI